jgi:Protein of unknown function (DUF2778)
MWTYEQSTGRLSRDGAEVGIGYSGMGAGKNFGPMQNVPNVGPIPIGNYLIGDPEDDAETGHYSIPLIPDPANEMFGRSAFRIHGDNPAHIGASSEGCIILQLPVRMEIHESADRQLQVISGE